MKTRAWPGFSRTTSQRAAVVKWPLAWPTQKHSSSRGFCRGRCTAPARDSVRALRFVSGELAARRSTRFVSVRFTGKCRAYRGNSGRLSGND
jgi:hypothetical protein